MIQRNFILGVGVSNATSKEVLEFLLKGLKEGGKKMFVVTPNPEIIVLANKNRDFKEILNSASLALPDGTGVIWAGKILGKKFKEKITGVDTLKNLSKIAAKKGFTVGFLGGGSKVAETTAECLRKKYPNLKVVFAADELPKLLKSPTIDILFVAFGAPKQEIWINKYLKRLPVKLAMGVGGSFDYLSGRIPRAPEWIQNLGFEWLFRLINEPWRIKRQLALLEFMFLVLILFFKQSLMELCRSSSFSKTQAPKNG